MLEFTENIYDCIILLDGNMIGVISDDGIVSLCLSKKAPYKWFWLRYDSKQEAQDDLRFALDR